jgi:hypothetical protein
MKQIPKSWPHAQPKGVSRSTFARSVALHRGAKAARARLGGNL